MSSSAWGNTGVDVFARSSIEENDEEALKWAALEKLPTYDRLRKGILFSVSKGGVYEIDVDDLVFQERKRLLERIVRVAEEDNEKFLLKLKNRIERVGIEIPTIEARFEHLNIEAEAFVGNRALPTFVNFSVNILEGFLNSLHILPGRKKSFPILKDVSGIIKPSRMTLLLGPPGCGKTTLLLALVGKLDPNLKFYGSVTYNGHRMNEFIPQRTAAYISQHDLHIGEMTVRETLAFSARCQGVGTQQEMLAELSRREKAANIKPDPDIDFFMKAAAIEGQETSVVTDYILKILGLEICADTLVGDEMIRGISGGQRKRVTTGEMLVGPAKALFMDEISTGLDSLTTYQSVNSLKQSIHILNGTAVISLLQPAPETYDLFDDIILLSDGQIVYQGPRDDVLGVFEYMGFRCPERKGVADFLQEVTSKKDQQQYWARKDHPYSFVTVPEFSRAFQSYEIGRKIEHDLSTPFDKTKGHPAALATGKYGAGKMELLKACFSREYLPMKRNSFIYVFKLSRLPVFYKQRDLLFYPAWAYSLPTWIPKIPITILEVSVWVFITYYVIGFDPNVGRLFKQYLLLLLVNQMSSALFRLIASVGRNMIVANTFGLFSLLILLTLGGVVLSRAFEKPQAVISEVPEPRARTEGAIAIQLSQAECSHRTKTEIGTSGNDEVNHNKKKGMVLPFEPHSLTFDNVVYSVDLPQGVLEDKLVLLKGVSGAFRPGVLTALMGVSGAGKTTLMDVLAGRKTGGYIEGSITISGYPKKQETFARISGYCEQNDIHSPHVTVYESLLYSAWLRLPREIDSDTRNMFVDEVMKLVELNPLRNALVGLPGVNGLSTEQRKRLTIAVELVANPSIIFMDEPTSGLDARAAAIVMRTVTVDTGRTVVCTIHQPSIDIFEAFDEEVEGVSKIKDVNNPATWMLEVTSSAQELALGVDFSAIYKNSELYRRNKEVIKELSTPAPGSKDLYFPTQYSQSFLTQCIACLWKQQLSYWRNPPYTAVRFLFTTFIALMFGTIFWDLGSKIGKQQDLINSMGSLYASVLFLGVQNSSSVQPVVIIELPYIFCQAIVYGFITYAMIGFEWTAAKFLWYIFFMYFTLLYFTYYGMMAVAVSPNHHIASIISSAFYGMWNLFSGFVIPRTRMPVWWRWYYWVCPYSWTLYGLIASQYGDIKHPLEDGTRQPVQDYVREYYGVKHDFLGAVAAVILGITVLFAFIFAVSIRSFNFQRRKRFHVTVFPFSFS
ncbi:hypothetical protein JCGZ_06053 [Jatropha curcas]|uniref:ABC transporter domain-containing protein n=1 Tax=Jatropha curcas TaxID=180498 RepID=A0A067KLI4_JATCU|nr:hypothetical protein JCGZ_06053 [Jatropha curcas]